MSCLNSSCTECNRYIASTLTTTPTHVIPRVQQCDQESDTDTDTDIDTDTDKNVEPYLARFATDDDATQVSLNTDFEEEYIWKNVESKQGDKEQEKPQIFEAPIPLGECPICYEDLKMIDFTVTKCGHTFHSSCVFKALESNLDCPMCRCQLLSLPEEDTDDDDNSQDYDNDDNDQDDATTSDTSIPSYASDEPKVTMDQLAVKLQNMGYTPVDFLTIYMNWYMDGEMKREDQTRQSNEFLLDFINKIDAVVEGRISLAHRDQRSYAQVVSANQK